MLQREEAVVFLEKETRKQKQNKKAERVEVAKVWWNKTITM